MLLTNIKSVSKYSQVEQKTDKNHKLCFYMPAIAPKDKINTSANRHYFREPSLEKVLVHSD